MASIAFFVSSMQGGGAERVAALLSNEWAAGGHDVVLVPTYSARGECAYPLQPEVKLEFLADRVSAGGRGIKAQLQRLYEVRKLVKEVNPDVIVSFLTRVNISVLLATWGLKIPVFVCERNYPPAVTRSWIERLSRRWLYRQARAVVMQTDKGVKWVEEFCPGARAVKIVNPVVYPVPARQEQLSMDSLIDEGDRVVLAVGRLHPQKRFDMLLNAFAQAAAESKGWRLVVLGEGDERQRLEASAEQLGLSNAVIFAGIAGNMSQWYQRADLFVMTSLYEGFPNALLEAMAHGVAVISVDCDTGPGEIIDSGQNGLLVPMSDGVHGVAEAMRKLMDDSGERARLGLNAKATRSAYNLSAVARQWEKLFSIQQLSPNPRPDQDTLTS